MDAAVKAWAQRALCELDSLLHAQAPELRELIAADVAPATIFTLYPFEPSAYMRGVHTLTYRRGLAPSLPRREDLDQLVHKAQVAFPYSLGAFLPQLYRQPWASEEINSLCKRSGLDLMLEVEDAYSFYVIFRFLAALNAIARPEPPDALRNGRSGLDYVTKQVPEMMPVAAELLRQAQRTLSAS